MCVAPTGAGLRDPLDDQYSSLYSSNLGGGSNFVNITTPPRVLTVDERFPVVDEEEETLKVEADQHILPKKPLQ